MRMVWTRLKSSPPEHLGKGHVMLSGPAFRVFKTKSTVDMRLGPAHRLAA